MKQKVTMEVVFEENYKCENVSIKTFEDCIAIWSPIIIELLQARINACKASLFANKDRVTCVTEYAIEYVTENGIKKHYSIPAAKAIEETISEFKGQRFNLNTMNLIQILKALYWASDKDRKRCLSGVSFDDLYSALLMKVGARQIPVFHP